MANLQWPLFDLVLTTDRLVLRVWNETDAHHLAAIVPEDWESNPFVPAPPLANDLARRSAEVLRGYWRSFGSWTADDWSLGFVVEHHGVPIGFQELEADRFSDRMIVETSSWLVPEARGQGLGKDMRAAVLHLAFDGLGAEAAETSAWWDRDASLGVSRGLGYRRTGERIHDDGRRRDRMIFMELTRAAWESGRGDTEPIITGLDSCLEMFGR